ncbi:hypothetical protein [Mangrovimonas aestuarii]|uniref:hypothetical protein n=1 Tax=Mangrovimonas aestuarii TaxID=3018443 RepID=UPI002379809C|nr:hypothetical protein [Mangrovimonas aestuarii]
MKSALFVAITAIALLMGGLGFSQTSDELQLIQDVWGAEKKDLIKDYMNLSPSDAEKFWPVYDEYTTARQSLGKERIKILQDYANSYENLTDEQADNLVERLYKNNMDLEKLDYKYYKKMKKVISPLQASKFIQVEKYIETVLKVELQSSIPFIGEMDAKMK